LYAFYLNHFSKKDQNLSHAQDITLDYSLIEPYTILEDRPSDVNAN
jgi:hypothetical protein